MFDSTELATSAMRRAEAAEAKLAAICALASRWVESGQRPPGERTGVVSATSAECGRQVLAITGPAPDVSGFWLMVDEDGEIILSAPCADTIGCLWYRTFSGERVTLAELTAAAATHTGEAAGKVHEALLAATGEPG